MFFFFSFDFQTLWFHFYSIEKYLLIFVLQYPYLNEWELKKKFLIRHKHQRILRPQYDGIVWCVVCSHISPGIKNLRLFALLLSLIPLNLHREAEGNVNKINRKYLFSQKKKSASHRNRVAMRWGFGFLWSI